MPTTYGSSSATARVVDVAAGLTLLLAALVASTDPRRRALAALAAVAGVLWFGPDWEGWSGGPSLVHSVGAAAAPLLLAVVFQLALSLPSGRLRGRFDRGAVALAYAAASVVAVGRALVRDPFLDPTCWRNCLDNTFLVHASPSEARLFDHVWLACAFVIGVALGARCAQRALFASRPALRSLWPGLAAGVLVGVSVAATAAALALDPLESPRRLLFRALFVALAVSVLTLAVAVAWSVVEARRRRDAVRRLAADLAAAPQPGRLEDALAAAFGDPTLQVAYQLADPELLVDAEGRKVTLPAPGSGRVVTPVTRGGARVAAVVHDESLDPLDLEREIGAASRLAVDNERLRAEVLAQLDALRPSRARIVAAGDSERRRLERNLHDGAQQRLLALTYQLRLAREEAEREGNTERALLLAECSGEADGALDDLRQLAHGIYPAILTESGVAAALATLAETAPIPIELMGAAADRYPQPVEAAAYMTAAEAIDDAAARDAGFVAIETLDADGELVISVTDDGKRRSVPPVEIGDRVGALGGSVGISGATLRASIPCG